MSRVVCSFLVVLHLGACALSAFDQALMLEGLPLDLAVVTKVVNGQRYTSKDAQQLGSRLYRLQNLLIDEAAGCLGDAIYVRKGYVAGVVRCSFDLGEEPVKLSTSQLATAHRMAQECLQSLGAMLVQAPLRREFLEQAPQLFPASQRHHSPFVIDRQVNWLLSLFYEATGITYCPFITASKRFIDPAIDLSRNGNIMTVPTVKYCLEISHSNVSLPAMPPHQMFAHCGLVRPSVQEKLHFLTTMIPLMSKHYKLLREQVVRGQQPLRDSSDVLFCAHIIRQLNQLITHEHARRRLEVYQELLFDMLAPNNVDFIMHCIALVLLGEVRGCIEESLQGRRMQLHDTLQSYMREYGVSKTVLQRGILLNPMNELQGQFLGDDLDLKKTVLTLLVDFLSARTY